MSFRATLSQFTGRLTEADQRLITVLLEHPIEASFLSAAELSARVNVHEASAVRLAQKLGYRGYPELRTALQADLLDNVTPAERLRRRLDTAGQNNVLASLVAEEVAALEELPAAVSQEQIDRVARQIIAARQVYLFANGNAVSLVELMERRLRRSGYDVVALRGQGRELAERIVTIGKQDVVLAFAFRTHPKGLSTLLTHATQVGAATVLVSDSVGVLVRPNPTILLAARRGADGAFQTLTVPMALCNALVLTIAQLDDGRTFQALRRLNELVQQFEKGGDQ